MRPMLETVAALGVAMLAATSVPSTASAVFIDFEGYPEGFVFDDYGNNRSFIDGGRVLLSQDVGGLGAFTNAPSGVTVWEITDIASFGGDGVTVLRTRPGFWYASSDPFSVFEIAAGPGACPPPPSTLCPPRTVPATQPAGGILDTWRYFESSFPGHPEGDGIALFIVPSFAGQQILLDDLKIPEPSTTVLIGAGMALLARRAGRARRARVGSRLAPP